MSHFHHPQCSCPPGTVIVEPPSDPVWARNAQCYYVKMDAEPRTPFVSAYSDLTPTEFEQHYQQELKRAIERGDGFVMAENDDGVVEQWTLALLQTYHVPKDDITLYRAVGPVSQASALPPGARPHQLAESGYGVKSVTGTTLERDEAMTRDSGENILWLRPHDQGWSGGMTASDVLNSDFGAGVKGNAGRRRKQGIESFMKLYDEVV